MTHHNGYSEEWRGTGGPTISANRIRAIEANRDLLRSELLLATAKPRHPVRNACIAALIFGAAGFWAGRVSAQDVFYALHISFRPISGGEWMTIYAGLLMTPELCTMAGNGVARELSAEVPDTYVTFTCIPVSSGVSA